MLSTRSLRAGGRSVPVLAGPNALEDLPRALAREGFTGRMFIVGDERALSLHGDRLPAAPVLAISGAEKDKTLEHVSRVWDWLVEHGAQRRDALVAFG